MTLCDHPPIPIIWDDPDNPLREVRSNPRVADIEAGHALDEKTLDRPDAYLRLDEIRQLAEAALLFLGVQPPPGMTVEWTKHTTRRGQATEARSKHGNKYGINFSLTVYKAIPAPERARTVIHEACHIATYLMYPGKNVGHGQEWQDLMRRCGLPPAQYSAAVPGVNIVLRCPNPECPPHPVSVSVKVAIGMRMGTAHGICPKCATRLTGAHVNVPAKLANKVPGGAGVIDLAPLADMGLGYACPRCKSGTLINSRGRMEAVLTNPCPSCLHPAPTVDKFQPAKWAYCLVKTETARTTRASTTEGAIFATLDEVQEAAADLPPGNYTALHVLVVVQPVLAVVFISTRPDSVINIKVEP